MPENVIICNKVTQAMQRRRKNVLFLVSKASQIGLKWKWRRPFFKTLPGCHPGDVLKTSLKRLETSSRLFLVKAEDHLETIYGLSIYVRFKLHHHSITRQTNCINLNKLNTLKHRNNAEMMKTWFSIKCQTREYFFQQLKYFFSMRVLHTVALLNPLLLKFEKRFRK